MHPLFPFFRLLPLAALAIAAITRPVGAQEEAPDPPASEVLRPYIAPPRLEGRTNGAFEYLKIWDTLSGPDNRYFRSHEIWFPRGSDDAKEAETWVASTGGRERQGIRVPLARRLHRITHSVAAIPDCSWGLPTTPDIDNLLFFAPAYMELMRNSAWALAADADRCINEGKPGLAVWTGSSR